MKDGTYNYNWSKDGEEGLGNPDHRTGRTRPAGGTFGRIEWPNHRENTPSPREGNVPPIKGPVHYVIDDPIHDPVDHPSHYTSDPSGVECIQITRHRNFNIGNAIKYLWRAGLKNQNAEIEDLRKAVFYIVDEIDRLEGR